MEKRIIDAIREKKLVPRNLSDEEISAGFKGSILESNIRIELAKQDLSNGCKAYVRNLEKEFLKVSSLVKHHLNNRG